jgi:ceramide glucosyltransferase
MNIVSFIAAVGVVVSFVYYIAASLAAIRFARRAAATPPPLPRIAPRVAVLKPLHGLNSDLLDNATSLLEARYPRVEFVFGVSGYEDRAAEVPLALKAAYQFADVSLSVGEAPDAVNRKVAKLIKMIERVPRAEIIVLSDADISVEPGYLTRIIGELTADEHAGIVTCIYRARSTGSFGSRLEALSVNTDFVPMAMLSEAIEPLHHAFGATIAIRRKVLDEIGGFAAIRNVLADDFFLGRRAAECGWEVKLSGELVTITCEERRVADFWNHQLRWARTYLSVRPVSAGTILTHGPFWALLLILASGFNPLAVAVLFIVVAARIAMASLMFAYVLRLPQLLRDAWLVPLKDLLMTGVWFASLAGREVLWGGRRFKLRRGGAMEEIKNQAP